MRIRSGLGWGVWAASAATWPYVVVRPVGRWVITLLAELTSWTGTPQDLAAANSSRSRASAPAS